MQDEKPSEAVLSVVQALSAQMGGTTLHRLAEAALGAMGDAPQELARLTEHLHTRRSHPDYEYETVTEGRKQSDGRTPEGEGWEWNRAYNDGGERFEYTEETYWRRLKSIGEAEREAAMEPVRAAIDTLCRGAQALVDKSRKAEQDMKDNPGYWGDLSYARGVANALDGDQVSIAALFDPYSAVRLAELLQCTAERLEQEPHRLYSTMVESALELANRFLGVRQ